MKIKNVDLKKIDREIVTAYDKIKISADISKYQSRIYPDRNKEIIKWYYIVAEKKYIGSIWLEKNKEDKFAVLGIFIGETEDRNQGLGEQAINKIIEIERDVLAIKEIHLNVREENIRAQRCYKKCGFIEIDHYVKPNGIPVVSMKKIL